MMRRVNCQCESKVKELKQTKEFKSEPRQQEKLQHFQTLFKYNELL